MSEQKPSIDGFIPRRRNAPETQALHGLSRREESTTGLQASQSHHRSEDVSTPSPKRMLASDIDSSLREIDDEGQQDASKKHRKRPINKRRLFKWLGIALLVILLAAGAYVGIKALIAGSSIFKGNLFGLVNSQPLKKDANGRSNILIFGTSGSVDDQTHEGANLTDSLIVLSVDQEKKDAYMVSIPRDLWVKYGRACVAGYEEKINALFSCYDNEEEGAKQLSSKVGEVVGLDIQYYVHVNWAVMIAAVNAVGGIDVTIESDDPRGVLDRNFDWVCNFQCYYVNYKQGERAHLDGEHALALARARGASAPTYGINDNFGRERNQQMIIKALREKAMSAGTLTDIGKVTSLIDALGANIKTNFVTDEFQTLMGLGRDIPNDKIVSIDLRKEGEAVVMTDNNGASIVRPVAGMYDYSDIAAYIQRQMTSDPAVREQASIGVYNGTTVSGLAQQAADKLSEKGFQVDDIDNAPDGQYAAYEVYDLTNNKPATKAKLESLYGTTAKTTAPPFSMEGLDFIVIVGQPPSDTASQ